MLHYSRAPGKTIEQHSDIILGKGYSGIVYSGYISYVQHSHVTRDRANNIKCAIKYSKIDEETYEEIKQNNNIIYKFWEKLNLLYPDLFLTLYDFWTDDAQYIIDFDDKDLSWANDDFKKYKNKIWNSKYTVIECMSCIDTTFTPLLDNIDLKIYYNCFIQLAYQITILDFHDLVHIDLHLENVGIKYTNPTKINICFNKINNYGYKVQLIDYESIIHKSWSKYTENKLLSNGSYYHLIRHMWLLVNGTEFYKYYHKYIPEYSTYEKNFTIEDEYKKKLKKYLPNEEIYDLDCIEKFLFKLLYLEKFQRDALKSNFTKFIEFKLLLPLETILFIIKNMKNPDNILYYLLKNQ
jgi:hypothetical protein